jgi:hypothetical protein
MTDHPITPPQWQMDEWQARIETMGADVPAILLEIAQWGADQEVGACRQWLVLNGYDLVASKFHAARRPKPPSLKEQALQALLHLLDGAAHSMDTTEPADYIRRALEQLDD